MLGDIWQLYVRNSMNLFVSVQILYYSIIINEDEIRPVIILNILSSAL